MNITSPAHLKHKLRRTRRKVLKFFSGVFAGLINPFCPECNAHHPDWAVVANRPWFCLRCFELKDEPTPPWGDPPVGWA